LEKEGDELIMSQTTYGMGRTFEASDKELYLNIEKEIMKYPSPRIELLKRIGGFSQPVVSHKVEWSVKDNRAVKTTLAIKHSSGATTAIVTTPGVFNVDDIIQFENGSQMVVEAVSGGTQLTVRALAGTPADSDFGQVVFRAGMATAQGKDADNMVKTGYEDMYNYTSILEDVVKLSGSEHEALIRGQENSAQLIARKQQELAETWQSQMVLGIRTKDDVRETTTNGGFKFLIDTYAPNNAIDFGGASTWTGKGDDGAMGKIDDALDLISAKVFDKPTMWVGAKFMRKFKYALADTDIQTTQALTDSRGIGVVGTYLSHLYGKINVVLIQERTGWMDDFVFIGDESGLGQKAQKGREWQTSPLAKTGDSFKWQVLSERTVKMDTPEANTYLHNLGL
jgi:hypothetical protein